MKNEDCERLFKDNTLLVYHIFNKHLANRYMAKVYKEDLIQEGMMSLWRACLFYDPDLGTQFSTYAYPTIRLGMLRLYKSLVKHDANRVDIDTEQNFVELIEAPDKTDQNELITILEMLKGEPPRIVKAVVMTLKGYTQREIAVECNTSQVQISRALKKFRSKVQSELNRRI